MKARGLGHIVNLSSIAGRLDRPRHAGLCHDQGGIRNLSQTLRLDLHGSGVRVSEIAPGRVETGAHLALLADREEGRRRFYEGYESLRPTTSPRPSCSCFRAPQRMDVSYMEIVPTDQSYGGSPIPPTR